MSVLRCWQARRKVCFVIYTRADYPDDEFAGMTMEEQKWCVEDLEKSKEESEPDEKADYDEAIEHMKQWPGV